MGQAICNILFNYSSGERPTAEHELSGAGMVASLFFSSPTCHVWSLLRHVQLLYKYAPFFVPSDVPCQHHILLLYTSISRYMARIICSLPCSYSVHQYSVVVLAVNTNVDLVLEVVGKYSLCFCTGYALIGLKGTMIDSGCAI